MFPFLYGFPNCPGLSSQLLTSTAYNCCSVAFLYLADLPTNSLHSVEREREKEEKV
jgi:hypothetical protein